MIIEKEGKTTKEINKILNYQMGGWLLESHVWGLPNSHGIQTCYLCGKEYMVDKIAKPNFPMCRKNPAILKLLRKYREFLEQKNIEDLKGQLLKLQKEIDEMSKRAYEIASKEESKWKSQLPNQKKS